MFLSQTGYSKRFTFDVIYSALQKSLRRGNIQLAIEMGYEFAEHPNALKKRLIQNCTEDCPNLNLINDIFNTPPELSKLMPFIPAICKHVKNHDGCFGMRIACERDPIYEPPKFGLNHDDLLTMLCKLLGHICQNDESTFITYFQKRCPMINLTKIYNFIDKHITFLYSLCVWESVEYINEKYELEPFDFDENKQFDMSLKLPDYVYDKHVQNSPIENKTFAFFLENLILYPRKEESEIEKEGRRLYLETNKGCGEFIKMKKSKVIQKKEKSQKKIYEMFSFSETKKSENKPEKQQETNINLNDVPDVLNEQNIELIQTQLVTKSYKPKTYYCSLNKGKSFDFILKGPFTNEEEIDTQILSNVIKQKILPMKSYYQIKKVTLRNQPYFITINLIPIDKNLTTVKSSKIETNSTVYDGNKYFFNHQIVESLSNSEAIELLKILAFRKIIGNDDTCIRNIIYVDKHIYSIDDAVMLRKTPYIFIMNLIRHKCAYQKIVFKNFDIISDFLSQWQEIVKNADDIPDNVKSFIFSQISNLQVLGNWVF